MSKDHLPRKGWTAERVRTHLQNAIYLEMWTVPLYLTAAYSLDVPVNGKTHRPEFAPTPTKKDGSPDFDKFKQHDYNQYAFNNILSVAIQEMLHVELAGNLRNAVRSPDDSTPVTFTGSGADPQPPFSAPQYDSAPACLKDDVLPSGVTLQLGKFDENQARLFQWVEQDQPLPPPPYDVEEWHEHYNSIGHFYTSLMYGMKACWADLYPSGGRAHDPYQRDDWESSARQAGGRLLKMIFGHPTHHPLQSSAGSGADALDATSYKDFSIKIYGASEEALVRAEAAMTATMVQGEGAGGTKDIPVKFQPTGNASDAIEIALDKVSHLERFHILVGLAAEGKFTYVQPVENPAREHFLNALNQSYSSFLLSLNSAFCNQGDMSIAAMAGLGNRELQAWQNKVTAREMFQWVDGSRFIDKTGAKGFHACQGLDHAGKDDCATGFFHTCAGANMCKGQGGCGALISNTEKPPIDWQPGTNECQGKGHCGIPIPALQCFVDENNQGQSVWAYARKLIGQPTDAPQPNDLRTALTGTGGECSQSK
ncbi:MAG TPA: ferritin-like domain-containing protein [Pyrinomonadaceae bacterium]|jgi:hypothetical protein